MTRCFECGRTHGPGVHVRHGTLEAVNLRRFIEDPQRRNFEGKGLTRGVAQALVGQSFFVNTLARGTYIGRLLEVTDDRPWRAKVRIERIVVWPIPINARGVVYHPLKEGEIIEVGGQSLDVRGYQGVLVPPSNEGSYDESFQEARARAISFYENILARPEDEIGHLGEGSPDLVRRKLALVKEGTP